MDGVWETADFVQHGRTDGRGRNLDLQAHFGPLLYLNLPNRDRSTEISARYCLQRRLSQTGTRHRHAARGGAMPAGPEKREPELHWALGTEPA